MTEGSTTARPTHRLRTPGEKGKLDKAGTRQDTRPGRIHRAANGPSRRQRQTVEAIGASMVRAIARPVLEVIATAPTVGRCSGTPRRLEACRYAPPRRLRLRRLRWPGAPPARTVAPGGGWPIPERPCWGRSVPAAPSGGRLTRITSGAGVFHRPRASGRRGPFWAGAPPCGREGPSRASCRRWPKEAPSALRGSGARPLGTKSAVNSRRT